MELNKTNIALSQGFIVPPPTVGSENNENQAITILCHFMQWGYIFDQQVLDILIQASEDWLIQFHVEALEYFQEIKGGKHDYQPLFPGFPQEVIEASSAKIFLNKWAHVLTGGLYNPSGSWEKPIEFEHSQFEKLELGSEEKFQDIFIDLVSINSSLPPQHNEIVKWFVKNQDDLKFPESIPFKETLCALAALGADVPIKTPTDVLRIATAMSGNSPALMPIPPRFIKIGWRRRTVENPAYRESMFKKFSRAERRYLLGLLEKAPYVKEMAVWRERWLRLGEIIHPGDYKDKFPKAYGAFDLLRNTKVKTWYSDVNVAFEKSFEKGLNKLKERPGEFARKLDALIRKNPKQKNQIMSVFLDLSDKISNKVLYELYEHFEKRREDQKSRSLLIKGARKPIDLPLLDKLSKKTIDQIQSTILSSFGKKFAQEDPLGKVWIDPELEKIPIPRNMRSLNPSMKPTIRGQRIALDPKAKVVRAFVHWFNDGTTPKGCDIDLSGFLFGANGHENCRHIGWNGEYAFFGGACVYSGDVQNRKGACAEYVDFDIQKCKELGFKYGVIDIRDYRSNPKGIQSYKDCVFGVMLRSKPESNTSWTPDTISNAHSINTPSRGVVVAGIDFETKEYFLIDMDSYGNMGSLKTQEIFNLITAVSGDIKFSLKDLLILHGENRGEIVETPEEADLIFNLNDFVHSYENTMKWMGI